MNWASHLHAAANSPSLRWPSSSISPKTYSGSIIEKRCAASERLIQPRSPCGRLRNDDDKLPSLAADNLGRSAGVTPAPPKILRSQCHITISLRVARYCSRARRSVSAFCSRVNLRSQSSKCEDRRKDALIWAIWCTQRLYEATRFCMTRSITFSSVASAYASEQSPRK
jgi:hypothetical protein